MNPLQLVRLAWRQVTRRRMRSALTILGAGSGLFIYTAVETMQHSLQAATTTSAKDNVLVVYRENRFCPFTSNLPEYYGDRIASLPGVAQVLPVKVVVNNCGTSLDMITFRGVPRDRLADYADQLQVTGGDLAQWRSRSDAALVGRVFAQRRGLKVGDAFDAAGVDIVVAGIIDSDEPQDANVAYVDLEFLQLSARSLGQVTQFNVKVTDPARLEEVADAIDAAFASDQEPTNTRPEKAFFAQTAKELLSLISFTRWVAFGAVLAVLALIANTILLAVRGRVKEQAIYQTLGYSGPVLGGMVVTEGLLLGVGGGLVGVLGATLFLVTQGFTIGSEGLTMSLIPTSGVVGSGLLVSMALGIIAGLFPAWQAARRPLIDNLSEGV